MKQLLLTGCMLFLAAGFAGAQAISINTDGSNADPSAILDVKSTEKGMLVPRMTSAQRNAIPAPAAGLLVYDTGTGSFWSFNGMAWTNLAVSNRIADTDNDTRIQVETTPDEDVIRFDVGGAEALVVDTARNVGIGTSAPVEKLDLAGAIKIGNSSAPAPAPGTIRWNETTADFEGYTGTQWKSLTKGPGTGGGWGTAVSYEQTQASAGFDSQTDAYFGFSVAIAGAYAVVGAYGKDVNGNANQGRAYVFFRPDAAPWAYQATLTASDGAADDNFGFSVAISGNTIVVGAPGKKGQGANRLRQGKCYVFVRSGVTWTQQAMLTASDGDAGDELGGSVAIAGDDIVAGAYYRTENGNPFQGKAYVFVRSGVTWSQQASLVASDGAAQDLFGYSVAIAGNRALICAAAKTINGNVQQGKAYLFSRSGTSWSEQTTFIASDGTAADNFGTAAALSDDYAVIGAGGKELPGGQNQGGAYIFARSGNNWTEQAILTASDSENEYYFGMAVSMSGDYVCIGAEGVSGNRKRAYVFERSGATWSQIAALAPSDGLANDRFGRGVGISGNQIIVGDIFKDAFGVNTGGVYFFSR